MFKNKILVYSVIASMLIFDTSFAAVKINKDDAAQYSKKSDFATEIDTGKTTDGSNLANNGDSSGSSGGVVVEGYSSGDDQEKFTCHTAKKEGNTYINEWSNYKLAIEETNTKSAIEFYSFTDPDVKFDFGIYWPDWSRLAIYYTRLSRDIDEVAKIFAHNKGKPRSVVIGGEVYRYIQEAIEYPYGTEYYDYYLRNVDGKLMVIECFHEKEEDIAPTYIERIEKYNG